MPIKCSTDNTLTDGLPTYSFKLNVRLRILLRPGECRRFDVLPDALAHREQLRHTLARYP